MSTELLILGAAAVVAVLLAAAWLLSSRQRSNTEQRSGQLREQFGSEYDRTLAEKGDTRRTERELTARQKRVASFHIKTLDADQGLRFSDEWLAIKASFVDDPSAAVTEADALLARVMDARGYPTGDFEQRFADVSVDHSSALEHYRSAHEIALRNAKGEATTEDLRQAVVNEHDLFAELIGGPAPAPVTTETETEAPATEEVEVAAR
jgi:FtsZ-interacting cell division protein ZipA